MARRMAVLLMCAALGCEGGDKLPPLHPVKGVVTRNDRPLGKALVRFHPVKDDPLLSLTAVTDAQGRFELFTQTTRGNVKKPGGPEGAYRVTIDLPMGDEQSGGGAVELPEPYTIKAGDNQFKFEIKKK